MVYTNYILCFMALCISLCQISIGSLLIPNCVYIASNSVIVGSIVLLTIVFYINYNYFCCINLESNNIIHYGINIIKCFSFLIILYYIAMESIIIIVGFITPQLCKFQYIIILMSFASIQIVLIIIIAIHFCIQRESVILENV